MQRVSSSGLSPAHPARWAWPLPALATWAVAWLLYVALVRWGLDAIPALALGMLVGMVGRRWAGTPMRRAMVGMGFPLSYLGVGLDMADQAWVWLVLGLLLLLAYPGRAWNDAPLFPTARGALKGLAQAVPLPAGATVLDAGCGLGHGLHALRAAYPQAQVRGVEWSWPLALATRLRCPWARVNQGDMWQTDWRKADLVYLFQRPESMARAWAKAEREMRPGSCLVSLEFPVAGRAPDAQCGQPQGQPVWVYRVGGRATAAVRPRQSFTRTAHQESPAAADNAG